MQSKEIVVMDGTLSVIAKTTQMQKAQLKTYRENVIYPVRIKKWRERIDD